MLGKIEYLADFVVKILQPLPITEQTQGNLGYAGAITSRPELPFMCNENTALDGYLITADSLLSKKGKSSFTKVQISSGVSQLKRFIDIVHAYQMAVDFDVVYVHGGGFNGDDNCLYWFWLEDPSATGNLIWWPAWTPTRLWAASCSARATSSPCAKPARASWR